jgi:prophage regulatory protein
MRKECLHFRTLMATSLLQTAVFLRLNQIIGNKKAGIPGLIPLSRTNFLSKVKTGEYPAPVRLGERSIAWRTSDIVALIAKLSA